MAIKTENKEIEIMNFKLAIWILEKWFSEVPKQEWFWYVWNIPRDIYTLLKDAISEKEIQLRIWDISKKLWIKESEVRKLNKNYTLTELSSAIIKWWKVIIKDELKVVKDL